MPAFNIFSIQQTALFRDNSTIYQQLADFYKLIYIIVIFFIILL